MNTWFSSNLGDPMLAEESLKQIKQLFLLECKKAKNTQEMAIYFRHESTGDVHCELIVYFSPATKHVAQAMNAMPCQTPSANGLGLLVGRQESRYLLFPDKAQ
ncbi:hypothetical protein [Hydrogenovibrio kuenenii]|uniref:hypothetical protein n=1 Tax=Hydrogenovibrio kuenenii TaxID=63658 RepID=UPI00046617F5|nr:hypothetical protein [Hydrogenovibrio kuenenii]